MIRNYFTIAFRNFWKNKGITSIQLLGLSAGLAACLLIVFVIRYENSFDTHQTHFNNVYRVVLDFKKENDENHSVTTPYPLPAALKAEFPEFKKVAAIHFTQNSFVQTENKDLFKEKNIFFTEPSIADILDIEIITGDLQKSLAKPGNVILTETVAQKYFGKTNAIGRTLRLENKIDLQVSGIMKDWPATSHVRPNMLVSYSSFTSEYQGLPIDQWGMHIAGRTYLLAPENFNPENYKQRFKEFVNKYYPAEDAPAISMRLQPLAHFHQDKIYKPSGEEPAVSASYLNIFTWIAALILMIALINYVNLSTARSGLRSREIGVRKVIGASKKQVMLQFLAESVLFALLSGIVAIGILVLILPLFNQLFEKSIPLYFSTKLFMLYTGSLITLGIIAGIYPALILASMKPLSLVRSKTMAVTGRNRQWVRQTLVTVQFACAIAFVFGSIVIATQIYYVRHKDPGFTSSNIINISLPESKHFQELRRDWQNIPGVQMVTFNLGAPVSDNNFGTSIYIDKSANKKLDLTVKPVDIEYPKIYGLKLVAGRWLNEDDEKYAQLSQPKEKQQYKFVINETLSRKLGFNNPEQALGKKYEIGVNDINGEIVGVLKDFHNHSLHDPIEPLLLMNFPYFYSSAGLKISGPPTPAIFDAITKVYNTWFPNTLFEYENMDEAMDKFYKADQQAFNVLVMFTIVAVLLAALGLVGLSVFVIQRRTREIGIRKVLGSSVKSIVNMLSWEFIKPVLFACAIAFPVAWWAMNLWLEDFAYRITISWWLLLLTGAIAIAIALCTVGFQSLKAAFSNPVKSLRTE